MKRKIAKPAFIVISIVLLLLVLDLIGVLPPLNNLLSRPLMFVQQGLYRLGLTVAGDDLANLAKTELIELNRDSQKQILDLTKQVAALKVFEEENKILVQQLDFLNQRDYRAVTARVIGRSPDYTEHVLIINRGHKDGLAPGYPVIAEEGIMVGKIMTVERNSAKVMLLTDGHSQAAGALLNADRTVGIVEGQYGLSLKMALIPQTEKVMAGDLVITSGLEENIPKGLLLAKVDHLITRPNDVFQSALLKLLIAYDKIDLVSVLLP
ncbi:MAG: rod shape-determining protein MreC [bacterium]